MIRSIAKLLLQYSYDSTSASNKADRVPSWLRRWIRSDSHLLDFERELQILESKLTLQSDKHIAKGLQIRTWGVNNVRGIPRTSNSGLRSPIALVALTAGLGCVLFVGRWLVLQPMLESSDSKVAISVVPNEPKLLAESNMREQLVRSTLEATKRLAIKWNQRSKDATNSVAFANQSFQEEGELVKMVGLEGIRFVGQKLPAATVRMLGRNAERELN